MQEFDRARMRELRESLDLSQVDAAKKAGMALSQWNDIENGRRLNPTVQTLCAVAQALGVDAGELLTQPAKKGKRKG
jgi:transcriptional regulator with XRE-family HTH domain